MKKARRMSNTKVENVQKVDDTEQFFYVKNVDDTEKLS